MVRYFGADFIKVKSSSHLIKALIYVFFWTFGFKQIECHFQILTEPGGVCYVGPSSKADN